MKVGLEKSFPMPASAETVWALLRNVEAVAACMPGAKIAEQLDERRYKGTIDVRMGPARLAFKGEIEIRELDETQRTLRLIGKGADSSGTSGASMDLTVRAEAGETPDVSRLIGKSELSMSGKAASFGGRMMGSVADQILKQFAENFAREVRGSAAKPLGVSSVTSIQPEAQSAAVSADGAQLPGSESSPDSPAQAQPPATNRDLNALSLLWAAVRDWVRSAFRRNLV